MMPDENPRIPEGINVSTSHPVKDLMLLSLGVCAAFAMTFLLLWYSLTFFVQFIPMSWESRIADPIVDRFNIATEQQTELQLRLDRVLAAMGYQGETPIRLTLIKSDDVNAFATLGGHVFVLTGLIDQLNSEVGLDMVLAHEAAHVLHRDPIKAATSALGISLVMALVTGNGDYAQTAGLMGMGNQLLFLNTSRDQERAADEAALRAIMKLYGHVEGAEELFVSLLNRDGIEIPALFSSHPHPKERINFIQSYIKEHPIQ